MDRKKAEDIFVSLFLLMVFGAGFVFGMLFGSEGGDKSILEECKKVDDLTFCRTTTTYYKDYELKKEHKGWLFNEHK